MRPPPIRQERRPASAAIAPAQIEAGSASLGAAGPNLTRNLGQRSGATSGRGEMNKVDIQGLVQRILLSIFALALVAGIGGFYLLLRNAALTQAEKEARILLSSALAMRDFTTSALVPKLGMLPETEFHPETVPA